MQSYEYLTMRRCEEDYWWYTGLRDLVLTMIRPCGTFVSSAKFLDVGCGTGGNLAFLAKIFSSVELYGLDISPLAISISRARNRGFLLQASAHQLPFGEGIFDMTFSLDLLYIQGVNDLQVLRECHRTLKSEGLLVVNVPAFEFLRSTHDLAVATRHRYTREEIRSKLISVGFQVNRVTYWNGLLFPFIFLIRKFKGPKTLSSLPTSDLKPLPSFVNKTLKFLLRLEKAILSLIDMPFGTSVLAIAKKV